jgi:hypothetical protein
MKRIVSLVTVAALMATMLAVGAGPAAAQTEEESIVPNAVLITKDLCKATDGAFFRNQGQCIKFANSL